MFGILDSNISETVFRKIDKKVMEEGPFEFRVLTQLPVNVKQQIARPLRELIGTTN